jgi:hypothetical protein
MVIVMILFHVCCGKNDEFCFRKRTENKICHFPVYVMVVTGLQ